MRASAVVVGAVTFRRVAHGWDDVEGADLPSNGHSDGHNPPAARAARSTPNVEDRFKIVGQADLDVMQKMDILETNPQIRKYMDLARFVSLLTTRSLYFACPSQFK
jgi:hypothetical protein